MSVSTDQLKQMQDNQAVRKELDIQIRWYIKKVDPSGNALCIPYQTRQDYEKVLNHYCGADWGNEHRVLDGKMYCSVYIKTESEGHIERTAAGAETNIESTKGEDSDSLKRAAMRWGILSDVNDIGEKIIKGTKEGKQNIGLTDSGMKLITKSQVSAYCNGLNTGMGNLRSIYMDNKIAFDNHPGAQEALGVIKEFLNGLKQ